MKSIYAKAMELLDQRRRRKVPSVREFFDAKEQAKKSPSYIDPLEVNFPCNPKNCPDHFEMLPNYICRCKQAQLDRLDRQ